MTPPIKSPTPAYAQENGSILIDVHISSRDQFYNLLDPSPEEEKDLDEETETYIRNAMEDLTPDERKQAQIMLYLCPSLYQNSRTRTNMEQAVTANFADRLYHEKRKYAFAMRRGQRYLIRGLLFLIICLVISSVFTRIFEDTDVNLAIAQGFVIIGWVALWKPVEFYLYDRRDLLDDLAVLEALVKMPVVCRKGAETAESETLVLM